MKFPKLQTPSCVTSLAIEVTMHTLAKAAEIRVMIMFPLATREALPKHSATVRFAGAKSSPSQKAPVFHHIVIVVAS